MKKLEPNRVRALLDYNPETGEFFWRWRPRYDFKTSQSWNHWTMRYAGKRAGYLSTDGYRYIKIDGVRHGEHRIAWVYYHGTEPDQIDHQSGDRTFNAIVNLRDVDTGQNSRNQAIRATNKSGVAGVSWCNRPPKWQAYIHVDGRQRRLGYFDRIEDAAAARKAAEAKYGYHPNHGRAPI